MRGRAAAIGLAVTALLALAVVAGPSATATVPPKRCGQIEVGGKTFAVSTHLLKCGFARKWSRRYLKSKDHPRGWSCTSFPPEETRIAFDCRKGGTSYYAVRK